MISSKTSLKLSEMQIIEAAGRVKNTNDLGRKYPQSPPIHRENMLNALSLYSRISKI
jgi:hypothetical protein